MTKSRGFQAQSSQSETVVGYDQKSGILSSDSGTGIMGCDQKSGIIGFIKSEQWYVLRAFSCGRHLICG